MAIQGLYKIFDHWHKEGSTWIISDTHFGDKDLAVGISKRPSDEDLVKAINSKCGKSDTLIHLGDVGDVKYVKKLRAKRKILIMGNHDKGRSNYERKIYIDRFDADEYTKEQALAEAKKRHKDCRYEIYEGHQFVKPFIYWRIKSDNMLFDEVYEGPLMIAEKLILSHEPLELAWAFNLDGHDHQGTWRKRSYNVCVDVNNYLPTNFNQWMKAGHMSKIETIHRDTIDRATERKRKRGGNKIGER